MGQSLLIDMNSGWYKHKTEVNDGLKTHNYTQVECSLDALNALLPEKYKVIIDTDEYNAKIRGNLVALCNHCVSEYPDPQDPKAMIEGATRVDYATIKPLSILLDSFGRLSFGQRYDKFWECPNCHDLQRLAETKFKQVTLQKPFYLQVVPEPPKRHIGIEDRNKYHNKFEKWARDFLSELNAQAQKFREEYKPKEWEKNAFQQIDYGGQDF